MPVPSSSSPSPIPSDKSVLCEPSLESDFSAAKQQQQQQQGGYDFINKPYEEWTQEDYARYYGDN